MTYWQKRQQQLNDQLEKDEEKLKHKLSKSYDIQQKKLEKEIAGYYQAYGENNVIEYRKLMESLSYEDKLLLLQRMDEFAEKYPQYAHLMPVRESIYKLNRLEGIQTSIRLQQLEMGAIDNAELQQHFEQLAVRSANSSAEQLGFGKNFYTVNSDLVAKTVGKQWADGKNFSERIWSNRSKLADYLNNDFAMAIARGDSYQKCIKALGERFDKVSRNDMYRLIYTEGTFVQNEASITPFEEDFEEYEISIADEKACNHCKAMRDKKFSIKDRKAGINFPPFHSWCRCSFTIAVDDWDKWMDDYVDSHTDVVSEKRRKQPENKNALVNMNDINSSEYRQKINSLESDTKASREIFNCMRDMLEHRTGTEYEDLAFIDSITHKRLVRTDYNVKRQCVPSKKMISMVENADPYTIIGVHNHPNSSVPSLDDINNAYKKKYKYGIIACHNGDIYKYRILGEFDKLKVDFALDRLNRAIYNKDENKILQALQELKVNNVELEVILWQ